MSTRSKHRDEYDIFTFPANPPQRSKPRPSTRPDRSLSVRMPPTSKGKLTTAERLKLAKAQNGQRLTQSLRRQKREREKAEACRTVLIRRKEDPNLVWDLTADATLGDQPNQPTQPDEFVSDDDEDEDDFTHPPEVRKLFTSPERVKQPSRQRKRPLRPENASIHLAELSNDENVPSSRLKKRRVTEPRKRVGIPVTSSVFAPNVRSAISNNKHQRKTQAYTVPKQRTPLKSFSVNKSHNGSQYESKIARFLHEETVQRERRRRQSVEKGHRAPDTSGSGEMVLSISTIKACNDDVQEVHQISDDESLYEGPEEPPARPSSSARKVLKRGRLGACREVLLGRQAERSIPAKTFYGKNDASTSNFRRRDERIVIPLIKGQGGEVPSEEIAQLSLREQKSSRRERVHKGQNESPTRRIQYSTDDDEEAERSQTDIRFKPLSRPELEVVRSLTFKVSKNKVMAKISDANIELKAGDFSGLRGSRWLNDEILNSFVALINARNRAHVGPSSKETSRQDDVKNEEDDEIMEVAVTSAKPMEVFRRPRPRTHVFNTFFFLRLSQQGYDYNGVRRWLKRAGRSIKDLDLIMFPINLSNFHWVLAAIDLRGKQFLYLDSTYGLDSSGTIPLLRRWLHDEVSDKHGEGMAADMQIDTWGSIVNPAYLPKQKDGGSCGIFTLYMAEYLERGRRPDFKQENIRTLRQRTALFLKRGKLPQS